MIDFVVLVVVNCPMDLWVAGGLPGSIISPFLRTKNWQHSEPSVTDSTSPMAQFFLFVSLNPSKIIIKFKEKKQKLIFFKIIICSGTHCQITNRDLDHFIFFSFHCSLCTRSFWKNTFYRRLNFASLIPFVLYVNEQYSRYLHRRSYLEDSPFGRHKHAFERVITAS